MNACFNISAIRLLVSANCHHYYSKLGNIIILSCSFFVICRCLVAACDSSCRFKLSKCAATINQSIIYTVPVIYAGYKIANIILILYQTIRAKQETVY